LFASIHFKFLINYFISQALSYHSPLVKISSELCIWQ
jgi:hypothetical protein